MSAPSAAAPAASAAAEFATFWHGPLNATAYSCLASFPLFGASLRLYAFDLSIDAPAGVEIADARRICPDASLVHRYLAGGKPSLAAFSDRFRYSLIRETGCCWVDTDIVCLQRPDFRAEPIVLGLQPEAHGKALVNNAVMKLPRDHAVLREMLANAEAAVDRDLTWGAIGPFLLTEIAEAHGTYALARAPHAFYPIGPDQFWQLLLPEYCERVRATVDGAIFLHLWSELLRRARYDQSASPPAGSYLREIFGRLGTLDRFARAHGEGEVRAMLAPWLAGADTRQGEAEPRDIM